MERILSRLSTRQKYFVFGVCCFLFGFLTATVDLLAVPQTLVTATATVSTALGNLQQPVNTAVIFVDVVIGAALTYLIYRTYRRQNDILGTQSEIFRAAHRPSLRAHDGPEVVNTHPINDNLIDEDAVIPEYAVIILENTGNDVAENLQLHCLISCVGVDDSMFEPIANDLQLVAEDARQVSGDNSLRPEDGQEKFYAGLQVADHLDESRKENPLGILLNDLTDDDQYTDIDVVRFGFAVTYESTLEHDTGEADTNYGSVYLRPAWTLPSDTTLEGDSVADACEQGEEYEIEFLRDRAQDPLKYHAQDSQ